MNTISVNIINQSSNELPAYATEGSAGMDLRANIEGVINVLTFDLRSNAPLERMLIPTGLFIELPDGYEAQIRPRSGLAIKQGITCLNSPGTIDSDYRGELKVILINLSKEPQLLSHGDRIAQMIISSVDKANLILVQEINSTQRGEGGFGHTGKK